MALVPPFTEDVPRSRCELCQDYMRESLRSIGYCSNSVLAQEDFDVVKRWLRSAKPLGLSVRANNDA